MASAVDQKTFWGLAEMVMWIRTRDHERVVALTDLSEPEAMVQAMFGFKPRFGPAPLHASQAPITTPGASRPRHRAADNRRILTSLS